MMHPQSLSIFLSSNRVQRPFAVVCGNPISHSLSPLIHNFAAQYHNLDFTYYPVLVESGEEPGLAELFCHPNFRGANITIPLKQIAIGFLEIPSDDVMATGACNTVYRNTDGKICGENTDISGFIKPLLAKGAQLSDGAAMVFGYGGAARAVIYALQKIGMSQIYVVRRNNKDEKLSGVTYLTYAEWPAFALQTALFVNTTPLGMHPNTSQSPVEDEFTELLHKRICYDIVYRPRITRFLKQAKAAGGEIIDGLDMFVGQASGAFSLFTGMQFPTEKVKLTLERHLE
jgi:shikimate dehydrogenase